MHRWALKILPVLAAMFLRRERPVGRRWRMDESYVKVSGQWKYLYRAVDRDGDTIDFLLRAKRNHAAARTFFERAIDCSEPVLLAGLLIAVCLTAMMGLITLLRQNPPERPPTS